jgi:hypothetical protein
MENLMEISPPYKHPSINPLTKKQQPSKFSKITHQTKKWHLSKIHKNPFAKKINFHTRLNNRRNVTKTFHDKYQMGNPFSFNFHVKDRISLNFFFFFEKWIFEKKVFGSGIVLNGDFGRFLLWDRICFAFIGRASFRVISVRFKVCPTIAKQIRFYSKKLLIFWGRFLANSTDFFKKKNSMNFPSKISLAFSINFHLNRVSFVLIKNYLKRSTKKIVYFICIFTAAKILSFMKNWKMHPLIFPRYF